MNRQQRRKLQRIQKRNDKKQRVEEKKIEYEIVFSHDLYDYLSHKKMIPTIMRGVSVASSGEPIPVSIQALKDFADRRSNYNNPFMKNDKEINKIIHLLNEEIALKKDTDDK